jgi:hypothetical protein
MIDLEPYISMQVFAAVSILIVCLIAAWPERKR